MVNKYKKKSGNAVEPYNVHPLRNSEDIVNVNPKKSPFNSPKGQGDSDSVMQSHDISAENIDLENPYRINLETEKKGGF